MVCQAKTMVIVMGALTGSVEKTVKSFESMRLGFGHM